MGSDSGAQGSSLDALKLIVAIALLGAGITVFYLLIDQALWVRLIALLASVGLAVVVVLQTELGRGVWRFATDSRTEVRKVVWPTRQETLQTTLFVVIAVVLAAIFLWLVDSLLLWVTRELVGV